MISPTKKTQQKPSMMPCVMSLRDTGLQLKQKALTDHRSSPHSTKNFCDKAVSREHWYLSNMHRLAGSDKDLFRTLSILCIRQQLIVRALYSSGLKISCYLTEVLHMPHRVVSCQALLKNILTLFSLGLCFSS